MFVINHDTRTERQKEAIRFIEYWTSAKFRGEKTFERAQAFIANYGGRAASIAREQVWVDELMFDNF